MGPDAVRHLLECSLWNVHEGDACLLSRLLEHLRRLDISNACEARERKQLSLAIERLLTRGYTLRARFPNLPPGLQQEWLGRRLILGHARWFWGDARWTSIVSSRLGRYGRLLADWPALLELLLRSIRRTGSLYLAVSDTTVAPLVEPLLVRSAVPHLRMQLPESAYDDMAAWLAAKLNALTVPQNGHDWELHLSPSPARVAGPLDDWPLQDRVAVCCGQRVRALLVRPQGTIAHLLEQRLKDPRFDAGSVSVLLPHSNARGGTSEAASSSRYKTQLAWLDQGAVGWYVLPRRARRTGLSCRQRAGEAAGPLWQLTSSYTLWAAGRTPPGNQLPRYLVHCVRGAQGSLPTEAAADLIVQAWLATRMPEESPLATLAQVLESRILRGRAALNRTDQACVSFSEVPLDQLITRRSFQSHLGRWDWEPFGLLIERRVLEQLGARPVIYGDSAVYRQLSPEERPYFQPARRRRAAFARSDWIDEREWRFMGDLRLGELPRSAVAAFVADAHQAQGLAQHSPWPVIWLADAQTREPPAGSVRRSRTAVRTGKN